VDSSISLTNIEQAASVIDPVFLNTPQFESEPLSEKLGVVTVLKVETINPIRSFKGRGTDYLLRRLPADGSALVCASAGNFGQGLAYACRKAGRALTVFAATTASPIKVDRMRALGAEVITAGGDFDEAKAAAKRHASHREAFYVEDGLLGPIAEGAGTIALELAREKPPLDAVLIPLGNGSLINGVGLWLKHASPQTRVIGVVAGAAPAMALSWERASPVTSPSATIADGIAVRVPVPEALDLMRGVVDEVMRVSEDEILAAIRLIFSEAALVAEPAAAVGVAAIAQRARDLAGQRVATPITGGNLTAQQVHDWLR
jgi:threonine dehydratase